MVKSLNVGISINDEKVCILLYADDIVFLTENETDLQKVLNVLNIWCNTNKLTVNLNKSKIVHFRTPSVPKSKYCFAYGGNTVEIVSNYTYLGLLFTEFFNYEAMAKAVSKSASRALGLLIAKCKVNGGFNYSTFTKLFDTLVWSVIEYGASIWGCREFTCINAIKNRAMRFFMGVGKYTPNLALYGDMGWMPCSIKQWSAVFRLWSRLSKMNNNRLNKRVFNWCYSSSSSKIKNWCYRVMSKFRDTNLEQYCDIDVFLSRNMIHCIETTLFDTYKINWCNQLNNDAYRKLRTYKTFKTEFKVESFLCKNMPIRYRSAFSKFRCGVAP